MKKLFRFFSLSAVVITAVALQSCQSEAPFAEEGEGVVRLNVDVKTNLTRAVATVDELKTNARIYISDSKGVLLKWTGTQNIPHDGFALRYGTYNAEVFAGDSMPASFDHRYFKGNSEFSVTSNAASTQVSVLCKIANVVASIDEATVNNDAVSDLSVEISHSKGSLSFEGNRLLDYGYFMMSDGENTLDYEITGVNSKGNSFSKTGTISDVRPGYNYRLRFSYNPTEGNDGGAFITVSIEEENLIEDVVEIYGPPVFSWINNDPEVDAQIIGTPGEFHPKTLRVAAYKGFKEIQFSTQEEAVSNILGMSSFDFVSLSEMGASQLESKGISYRIGDPKDDLYRYFIEFSADFLNALPARDTEYVINMVAVDNNNRRASYDVRIANTEAAIVYADPVKVADSSELAKDLTSVRSRSVSIPVTVTKPDVENPALQYREAGASSWTTVPVNVTRASDSVLLSGLKPSTAYQYRVVAGALVDGKYEFESEISSFTTESVFSIPNAGLEEWSNLSSNSKVLLPGANGSVSFWDTGNHGSATMSKLVTNKSESMKHGGQFSAELKSQFVGVGSIGKFAAGNLFVGSYDKTDGTDGELTFGRPYDGSHPSALSLYANYRPGVGDSKGGNKNYIAQGATDKGQIYVALTSAPVEIKTKTKQLFDPDADYVIAYGEITWNEAFGADGQLDKVTIPLNYKTRAKTVAPTHLVIVCSASKYGDFFSGGEGSLMYVDDFELVYE